MSKRLEDKIVEFRQYLALGHVNMDILNQASEIHELVIEQAERVQRLEKEWLSIMKKLDNRELTIKTYYNEINRLHEQNKRYREALENIMYASAAIYSREMINAINKTALKALEETER